MKIASVLATARQIRKDLLARSTTDRDLAGCCALASMQLADQLDDPNIFRSGFFMNRCSFMGKVGRYPHCHAWCHVGNSIVDITATQFGRFPSVYVVAADETDRYVECADGPQAVEEVMTEWRLDQRAEYRKLSRRLQGL